MIFFEVSYIPTNNLIKFTFSLMPQYSLITLFDLVEYLKS